MAHKPQRPHKVSKVDWSEDPDFKKFAEDVLRGTVPKIADSAYVMAIAPMAGNKADIKQAVEIGLAILMDKPLIVIAPTGRTIADRLLRIADHVIEGDLSTEAGRENLAVKMKAIMGQ